MIETNKVFVYGTLKEGGHFAQEFNSVRKSSEPAEIQGTMFSVNGMYPAVILEGNTVIHGEIHEFENFERILPRLDMIEGYNELSDPPLNLYNRSIITITTLSGKTVEAWIYTFNRPTKKYEEVESGIWNINPQPKEVFV